MMKKRFLFLMTALIAFVGVVKAVTPLYPTNKDDNWLNKDGAYCDPDWGNDYASASEFIISTPAQLAKFSLMVKDGNDFSDKTVYLGADLDMKAYYWYPISNRNAAFKGTFNGMGYTISGIITSGGTTSDNGLFGAMYGGTIMNLKLSNSWIQHSTNVLGAAAGAIVGYISGASNATASTTIINCYVDSDVTVAGTTIGGIAGDFFVNNSGHPATIEGCISYAKFYNFNNYNIGGIIGKIEGNSITIKNCVYGGDTFELNNYSGDTGAIYGKINSSGSLQLINNFCLSNINGITDASDDIYQGVKATPFTVSVSLERIHIGYNENAASPLSGEGTPYTVSGITAYDDYMVFNNTQYARIGGTVGVTVAASLDHCEVVDVVCNNESLTITNGHVDLPINSDVTAYTISGKVKFIGSGTDAAPYQIWNKQQMTWLANYVNSGTGYGNGYYYTRNYILCEDLDYTDDNYVVIGTTSSNQYNYFEGVFDGQGHTISHVNINRQDNLVGLFRHMYARNATSKATIKNLTLSDATISGAEYVGGITGRVHHNAQVINCHVINSTITGSNYVGGIAGSEGYNHEPYDGFVAEGCIIEGCTSTATVIGSDGVGGILGLISKQGHMDNCLYLGAVSNVSLNSGASGSYGLLIGKYAGSETYLSKNYYYNAADETSQQAMDIKAIAYQPVDEYIANATLSQKYDYDGIKAYANPTGLVYGDYFYSAVSGLIPEVTLVDGTPYDNASYAGKTATSVTYQRSFKKSAKGKYKGWFVPFNYTITADDAANFSFFKIKMIDTSATGGEGSGDKQYIHLEPLNVGDVMYGNRPYIFRDKMEISDESVTYDFNAQNVMLKPAPSNEPNPSLDAAVMTCATTDVRYIFYGVLTAPIHPTPDVDHFYYMTASGKFSRGTKETTVVGPYRWIFRAWNKPEVDNGNQILAPILFDIEEDANDNATAITQISHETSAEVEGYYTLDGVKVQQMTKGIYIVKYADGSAKKVVK